MSQEKNSDLSEFSMMDLFRMEVETQVDNLNQGLLTVEQDTSNTDVLETLMRAAHSIKGAARMVNVEPIVRISHEVEECFVALQHQQISLEKKSVDHLFSSFDLMAKFSQLTDEQMDSWELENESSIEEIVTLLQCVYGSKNRKLPDEKTENNEVTKPEEEFMDSTFDESPGMLTIRVPVDRLDRILDLAGKSLVQTHELNAMMPDFWHIKHQQQVIISQLNRLQEDLTDNNASDALKDSVKSILGEANILRHQYADGIAKLDTIDRRSSNIADSLHQEIMSSRMRPISEILNGLPRLVRDFSHRLNKNVRLQMSGLYTLVDRHVLERIDTPIKHLVQNAIDHGIELPVDRAVTGKNKLATLTLNVSMNAGMLLVVLADDGQGIDVEKVKRVAISKGIAKDIDIEKLSEKAIMDFLFYPGFSTQENVSEISGRGVGLDLVKDVVVSLNGSVQVSSIEGQGTSFHLCLPQTISVMKVLLTTICGESYAFPVASVETIDNVKFTQLTVVSGRYYADIGDQSILLVHANKIFDGNLPKDMPDPLSILILYDGQNKYGVVVENTHGEQELSIQNLSAELGKIRGINSAAILSSGELTLIIDIDDYLRSIETMMRTHQELRLFKEEVLDRCEVLNILVVDDSMTVREMQRKVLKEQHYQVSVAEHGIEALEKIQQERFDMIVTDVDMPNMDGLRLINEIRYLVDYADMPILVVSNREESFIKQSIILDQRTLFFAKDQFTASKFLSYIQLLSQLVVNTDSA